MSRGLNRWSAPSGLMRRPPQWTKRPAPGRGEKIFASVGVALVLLFALFLFSLLLAGDGQEGFGGGGRTDGGGDPNEPNEPNDSGRRHTSPFFTGTTLLAITGGYLALLAVWALLRNKQDEGQEGR